nr:hypothetical protein [Rhizobium sp. 18055]
MSIDIGSSGLSRRRRRAASATNSKSAPVRLSVRTAISPRLSSGSSQSRYFCRIKQRASAWRAAFNVAVNPTCTKNSGVYVIDVIYLGDDHDALAPIDPIHQFQEPVDYANHVLALIVRAFTLHHPRQRTAGNAHAVTEL